MKFTFTALMLFGLTVALFRGLPGQGLVGAGSIFQVASTPNENSNTELFAASAFSPNDIWAVGNERPHKEMNHRAAALFHNPANNFWGYCNWRQAPA